MLNKTSLKETRMHRLIQIRILRDYESLEDQMRTWKDIFLGHRQPLSSFRPAADLIETAQGLALRLEVPGVGPEDLSLTLAGQELIIRGQRRPEHPQDTRRFLHHEMSYGPFERSFLLPIPIDPEQIQARCTNGILEVLLPRLAPRRIPVKDISDQID
jgi:HSP20 family protein